MSYLINLFVEVKVKKDLVDESKEVLFFFIISLILIYIFFITFYLLFINYVIVYIRNSLLYNVLFI